MRGRRKSSPRVGSGFGVESGHDVKWMDVLCSQSVYIFICITLSCVKSSHLLSLMKEIRIFITVADDIVSQVRPSFLFLCFTNLINVICDIVTFCLANDNGRKGIHKTPAE